MPTDARRRSRSRSSKLSSNFKYSYINSSLLLDNVLPLLMPMASYSYEETFGLMFVAAFVSAFLCGATTVQTYFYSVSYKKDPTALKLLVAISWVLSMLHTILLIYATWFYTVKAVGNPFNVFVLFWPGMSTLFVANTQICFVQLFLARRVHKFLSASLSRWKKYALCASFLVLIFSNFVVSLVGVSKTFTFKSMAQLREIDTYSIVSLGFNIAVDTTITGFLGWALLKSRTGVKRSDHALSLLILLTVNTGLLPCLLAIAGMISLLHSRNTFWFLLCLYLISDCYANCLLANLNSRSFFKSRMTNSRGSTAQMCPTSVIFGHGHSASRTSDTGSDGIHDVDLEMSKMEDPRSEGSSRPAGVSKVSIARPQNAWQSNTR